MNMSAIPSGVIQKKTCIVTLHIDIDTLDEHELLTQLTSKGLTKYKIEAKNFSFRKETMKVTSYCNKNPGLIIDSKLRLM